MWQSVNVEKEYDMVVQYDDRYEIDLGSSDRLAYKVQYLQAILEQLSDFQAGHDRPDTQRSEPRKIPSEGLTARFEGCLRQKILLFCAISIDRSRFSR